MVEEIDELNAKIESLQNELVRAEGIIQNFRRLFYEQTEALVAARTQEFINGHVSIS